MNKKICVLICFMLLLGAIIPIVSNALVLKPDKGPLKSIILEANGNQNWNNYRNRRYEARPPGVGGGPPGGRPPGQDDPDEPEPEGGYVLLPFHWSESDLAAGITYNIDVSGSGLTIDEVTFAISASAEEWDSYTITELFNPIDEFTVITDGSFDKRARNTDGKNEIVFGKYRRGVIAVTIIWYYSGSLEIAEFDIMFNTDFTWGTNDDTNVEIMDLWNIATHELGHAVCLGDLYDEDLNSAQTMYGYSWYGDVGKRDLYLGDIAGIQELYG